MRKWLVLRVAFFLLFVGYFCAVNLFSHTHIVNGYKIVHSHPYHDGHTHNTNEYQLIQNLTHFSISDHFIDISFQVIGIELQKKKFYHRDNYNCQKFRDYFYRGPPCFV